MGVNFTQTRKQVLRTQRQDDMTTQFKQRTNHKEGLILQTGLMTVLYTHIMTASSQYQHLQYFQASIIHHSETQDCLTKCIFRLMEVLCMQLLFLL